MTKFTDTITITIKSGNGGPGAVTFHREKYVAKGGPDGGDGGKGGNVYIMADRRYYNLSHFFKDRVYKAKNGYPGMSANRQGKDGEDLTILVPPGTQVIDAETDEVLCDLLDEDKPVLLLEGGIGGKGNAFFKSSTHQTPRFAQPGMPGQELYVVLNLKLIAEIGLVGLPNAGKSTLLSSLTNANPKIGNYPFTTLIPNLGVIERENKIYTMADIPGIIEGAHKGLGLGLSFLQHIERVKVILYIIDIQDEDINYTLKLLQEELITYKEELADKPSLIVLTKIDIIDDSALVEEIITSLEYESIISVSAQENIHLDTLLSKLDKLMEQGNAA